MEHSGHGASSTLVSPENSEDGKHPPVADGAAMMGFHQQAPGAFTNQQQQMSVPVLPPTAVNQNFSLGMPLAPNANVTASLAALTQQQMQSLGMTPDQAAGFFQQQQQQQPAGDSTGADSNAVKRRRMEDGSAMAANMLNGQQLAAAAAHAMEPEQGKGTKKQAKVDRRRERNRILARRTRLRKKFFFESLQKEVVDLQRENLQLKDLVKTNLEDKDSRKILDECDAAEKLPPGVLEACGEKSSAISAQDFNLVKSIQGSQHSFIITDPSLEDNPIVFASDDFLKLTGYGRDQVLGRNCRFLQGTDTNKDSVDQIRKGLAAGEDVSVTLINYTADGVPFWNKLFIAALRDAQNNIVNFIGVAVKVATPEPGHPEHGKLLEEQTTEDDAECIVKAMEDSVSAAVAAAGGQ